MLIDLFAFSSGEGGTRCLQGSALVCQAPPSVHQEKNLKSAGTSGKLKPANIRQTRSYQTNVIWVSTIRSNVSIPPPVLLQVLARKSMTGAYIVSAGNCMKIRNLISQSLPIDELMQQTVQLTNPAYDVKKSNSGWTLPPEKEGNRSQDGATFARDM
eukprot:1156861-Pelagomonas_calceolata.AAC.5